MLSSPKMPFSGTPASTRAAQAAFRAQARTLPSSLSTYSQGQHIQSSALQADDNIAGCSWQCWGCTQHALAARGVVAPECQSMQHAGLLAMLWAHLQHNLHHCPWVKGCQQDALHSLPDDLLILCFLACIIAMRCSALHEGHIWKGPRISPASPART